jgi:hypothetical protein
MLSIKFLPLLCALLCSGLLSLEEALEIEQGCVAAGEWQLPSMPLSQDKTPLSVIATLCRGLLKPRPRRGGHSARLQWNPSTFVCGKRFGRPMLVLVYEAVVDRDDVVPYRAGLVDKDVMWVYSGEYADMRDNIGEVCAALLRSCSFQLCQIGNAPHDLLQTCIQLFLVQKFWGIWGMTAL